MPCYLTTRIIAEKFKTDPEILGKALPDIFAEMKRFYPGCTIEAAGGVIAVTAKGSQLFKYDASTFDAEYTPAGSALFNALKRCYSKAVVETVAGRSRIRQKFILKKANECKLLLQRRRA